MLYTGDSVCACPGGCDVLLYLSGAGVWCPSVKVHMMDMSWCGVLAVLIWLVGVLMYVMS